MSFLQFYLVPIMILVISSKHILIESFIYLHKYGKLSFVAKVEML